MKMGKILLAAMMLLCVAGATSVTAHAQEVSAPSPVTWTEDLFEAENARVTIGGRGYGEEGNSLELSCRAQTVNLYITLPAFEDYAPGSKIHVSLRLRTDGMVGGYSSFELCTWGSMLIDYAYENELWNLVNFDGTLMKRQGKNTLLLTFKNALRAKIVLSDFTFDDDVFETEDLFGGVEVYQYEGSTETMMLGFMFVTKEGKLVLYDGGYMGDGANLAKLIHQYGRVVSGWFLSHMHNDHYSGLLEVLENSDVVIENLYFNFPSAEEINLYSDEDKEYGVEMSNRFAHLKEEFPGKILNVVTPKKGDVYTFDELKIKVLNDMALKTDNFGNNTTIVYKAETPGESILLLGDLGSTAGDDFLEDDDFLREMRTCRVVQMAHHGQNGTTFEFYSAIDEIKLCLYPAPDWLYDCDGGGGIGSGSWKTLQTRGWMRDLGARVSLSCGKDGRIHFE